MWTRKVLLGAIVASTLGAMAPAQAAVDFYVNVAPPAPRYEVVPESRRGYVWVPGYWDWRGHRHVWVRGHWERERHGYYYHPSRWYQRDGRWYMERGRWDRRPYGDRDRDGIPNWADPNDRRGRGWDRDRDGVPNRVDRDRDGDGVPNYRDDHPNNPRRR